MPAIVLRLDGRVAIVTGCGSCGPGWGNGKATAVLLARQGATMLGLDLDAQAAEETRRLIEDDDGTCAVRSGDVTDAGAIDALVEHCLERWGRIDVLVNNVGRSVPGGPAEIDETAWDAQLELNLTSAYLTCRAVLPVMERQGAGAVVNVASVVGLRYAGKPQVAYAAAKAGLMQFTRSTAVIYADRGVRLNCVVPGLMDTPLMGRLADEYAGGDLEALRARRDAQVPMGRMGDAWDVAHAVLFLVSDEARYVTATEIVVDGGLVAATR
jgi:NAD(P)-dependent dehydrogenase (short-subunit alcohol dehydrogenase family)